MEKHTVEGRFDAQDLAPFLPPAEVRPDRLLEEREERELARSALDREDARHRTVVLTRLKGKTYEEAGAAIGVGKQRAREMMSRAAMRMRVRIADRKSTGRWMDQRVPRLKMLAEELD